MSIRSWLLRLATVQYPCLICKNGYYGGKEQHKHRKQCNHKCTNKHNYYTWINCNTCMEICYCEHCHHVMWREILIRSL